MTPSPPNETFATVAIVTRPASGRKSHRRREWLSDLMRHTGFTLLAALPTETIAPQLKAFLDRIGARYARCLKPHTLPNAPADLIAGSTVGELYLVRPDGYVALRAAEDDTARIESWLASTLL